MIMAVLSKLTLAVVLACALWGCGRSETSENQPLRRNDATPAVTVPPAVADTRPVIDAFGDSLSAGLGLDPGRSYPDDLQHLLDTQGFHYRVVNSGVSGDTTTDGLERLPAVLALKPEIIILEFGANDGLRGQPVESAQQNLARMIEALEKAGAKVVLAGMTLPRNYGPEYIHSFEQMYIDLGDRYRLVRIPFLLDGVGGVASLTQPDGLHPTAKGAEIVANTVLTYLKPLLRR
ncbi:MAG: arylesterase [Acidobacteriota bacterium]|nr:arylesterase [Acidobacteriota bacterium]